MLKSPQLVIKSLRDPLVRYAPSVGFPTRRLLRRGTFRAALQCTCRPSDKDTSRDKSIRPYHGVYEAEGVHSAGAGPELAALCGTGGVESIFRVPSMN